ncbi:MAG TPA: phage tail tip lysozyme [Kofleriaceae bacterium]|nr:phage tail tip lysozyme [Kofleriaceae bacterium]
MKATFLRYASLSLIAVLGAATAGCATDDLDASDDSADTSTVESDLVANETPAWNFFIGKGLTAVQTAGVIGNLMQESGMNPTIAQIGGGPGRGIAQWSVGGRWDTSAGDNLRQFAAQRGLTMTALNTELQFIWFELTTFPGYGLSQLRAATTITAAVTAFQDKYEICGACAQANRISFAQEAFNAFAGTTNSGCSVHSDSKLYCTNTAGAAMRATPTNNGTIVNHLRTTFSFFECWGTGDLHAGGNHTWYRTIGDDNANRGWIPAVDLNTTSAFDANPSAQGLPHC